MEGKISIIIPVYNKEQYLESTLDSIINQSYRDIEIIVVDDGSTDSSINIIERYKKIDKRIISLYNNANIGAPMSRNKGFKISCGDYVIFLDADDIYADNFLASLMEGALEYDADVICCKSEVINSLTNERRFFGQWKRIAKYVNENEMLLIENPLDFEGISSLIDLVAWNKLIRRSHIIDNNIEFQNISSYNDVSFALLSCILAKRVVFYNRVLIEYYSNLSDSITKKRITDYCPISEAYFNVINWDGIKGNRIEREIANRGIHDILHVAFDKSRSGTGKRQIINALIERSRQCSGYIQELDPICNFGLEYLSSCINSINENALINYVLIRLNNQYSNGYIVNCLGNKKVYNELLGYRLPLEINISLNYDFYDDEKTVIDYRGIWI